MPTLHRLVAAAALAGLAAPAAGLVAKNGTGEGKCTKTAVAIL